MVLSHAGTTLLDLYPSASRAQQHLTTPAGTATPIKNVNISGPSTLTPGSQLSAGQKKDRVRSIEEGVRKSLAGLEGGWRVSVDDGGLVPHTTSGRVSPRLSTGPAHVPSHVFEETNKPLNADIIGAYPSSHLNNTPAPIPHSPHGSFGQGTAASPPSHPHTGIMGALNVGPAHKHRSSFDHPVQASHSSFGTPSGESALRTDSPPALLNDDAVASHPTVAETGIPVDNSHSAQGPGPATGQLERREKPEAGHGVVRLNSLGGAGLEQGQHQQQHGGDLPGYGEGYAARASAPEKSGEAYPVVGGSEGLPPPPQHPAIASGTTHAGVGSGVEGMTPREQAEYYYRQSQSGAGAGAGAGLR